MLPVPGNGRGDVPGNLRCVIPAGGTLENLDHLQCRPGVIGQVEIRHRQKAAERLEACPVRAGEQGGLHAVVALVEVIRELWISQHRERPLGEQPAVRRARGSPRQEQVPQVIPREPVGHYECKASRFLGLVVGEAEGKRAEGIDATADGPLGIIERGAVQDA